MSFSAYKVPAFRSTGIGGAGNFKKTVKTPTIEITPAESTKKRNFIMRGIGGAGNALPRAAVEAQPRAASVSSERSASICSMSSGHYHGIGGRGNWSYTDEKRRDSSETDMSLI
jgi:hypothetical protein